MIYDIVISDQAEIDLRGTMEKSRATHSASRQLSCSIYSG